LRHVNVVQFFGASTTAVPYAIVTEFLSKGSLWNLVKSERIPWPRK
jgi:hypothetical protein